MSRTGAVPTAYTTFSELERGYLHQVRRFRHACGEIAASRPIMLNAPGMSTPRAPERPSGDDPDHRQLELLRSQVILLQNMSAQIIVNFPGDSRANVVRKKIDDLCRAIEDQSEKLRTTLDKTARKQVDRTVVVRNHALMQHLKDTLGNKVGGITEMYLVGDVAPPGLRGDVVRADVAYLRLEDLKGPDGFLHPTYYLVTAHPREGSGLADMYVSAGPEYRVPNRVRWLAYAKKPGELVKVAMDLLLSEHVIGKANERDLPVQPRDVHFVHDNVKKTVVKGNQIMVTVKNVANIHDTLEEIRRQLVGIVRQVDPKNRDVVRDRVDEAKKTITLTFSLPGSLRGRVIDPDVLRRLGSALDLDPATIQRVKTAIENPE